MKIPQNVIKFRLTTYDRDINYANGRFQFCRIMTYLTSNYIPTVGIFFTTTISILCRKLINIFSYLKSSERPIIYLFLERIVRVDI